MSVSISEIGFNTARPGTRPVGPPEDDQAISRFLAVARDERGLSANTVDAYRNDLLVLHRWLRGQDLDLLTAGAADIEAFMRSRTEQGARPLSTARQLSSFRMFYRYLYQQGVITADPTKPIEMPKVGRPRPRLLTDGEIEALLRAPELEDPVGYRDRVMLEMLFATGLRASELIALRADQLNLNQSALRIRGLGGRIRLVPIPEDTRAWLQNFVAGPRFEILLDRESEFLFPTRRGGGMTRQAFWHVIKRYTRKAGIVGKLSPHTLRHAFASRLLSKGTDIRVVQRLLGHSDLSTTQRFTAQRTRGVPTPIPIGAPLQPPARARPLHISVPNTHRESFPIHRDQSGSGSHARPEAGGQC